MALYTNNWKILFWLSYTTFLISLVFLEIWRHTKMFEINWPLKVEPNLPIQRLATLFPPKHFGRHLDLFIDVWQFIRKFSHIFLHSFMPGWLTNSSFAIRSSFDVGDVLTFVLICSFSSRLQCKTRQVFSWKHFCHKDLIHLFSDMTVWRNFCTGVHISAKLNFCTNQCLVKQVVDRY